jgi:glycosyltransferase involved in cell wall biosynthesis
MNNIAVNARFLVHQVTGMQRYAVELCRRFESHLDLIRPAGDLKGLQGHLWEQVRLPTQVGKRLLWSPNTTGPLVTGRQICTFHDLIPLEHPEWFSPKFSAWYSWLLPRLARRVSHIIAVSQFTKSRIVERLGVPPGKVTVVLNGIDARFYPRPSGEISQLRQSLGLGEDPYVLCTGAFVERKNTPRLLRSWERICGSLPENIKLLITGGNGTGGLFSSFRIGQLPRNVCAAGYIPDDQLPALYSGAIAFVYPSLYEGFGLPPLEAMACGTPVLTSNVTALPEVVGDAGLLVDPTSEEAIANGLLELLQSEPTRDRLRQKGLERVESLSWDRAASQTWDVLLQAA